MKISTAFLLAFVVACGSYQQPADTPSAEEPQISGEPTPEHDLGVGALSGSARTAENPLVGGFTAAEAVEVLKLRSAFSSALNVVSLCGGAAEAEGCQKLFSGVFQLGLGTGWLLHVNVAPSGASGEALLAGPRSAVLTSAWAALDQAVKNWCGAINPTLPCTGGAAAVWGGNAHFTSAVESLKSVDRTLAYATPFPADTPGTVFPNQFGPHGDYPKAQRDLWLAYRYLSEGLSNEWLTGLQAGSVQPCPVIFQGGAVVARRLIVDTWFLSTHLVSAQTGYETFQNDFVEGLPDGGVKRALTEYALLNGPADNPTAIAANRLFQVLNLMCVGPDDDPQAVKEFSDRIGDSWQRMDFWTGTFSKIE